MLIWSDEVDCDCSAWASSGWGIAGAISIRAYHDGTDAARTSNCGESGAAARSAHNDPWSVEV